MNSGHFCGSLAQGNLPLSTIAAAEVDAVAADELRRRIDHDVEAVLDRAEQRGRQRGVVDDRRQPVAVGKIA